MADVLSPVETLRAAARVARGGDRPDGAHWWQLGPIGEPLAGWLEREAFIAESVDGTQMAESADGYLSWPLAVARILLGASDGE